MRRLHLTTIVAFAIALAALAVFKPVTPAIAEPQGPAMTTTPSGLQYEDTVVGTGETPETGQICVMHYTGWLYQDGKKGAKFDSSIDRGKPFEFPIGTGRVIKGWDEGVA